MRAPTDMPRPRRGRLSSRARVVLVVLAVALFILLTSLRGIAGFYTDYLWFDSLGFSGVFEGVLGAKVALGLIFTGVFFVLMWGNLRMADALAPRFRPAGPEEEVIERYRALIGNRTELVRLGLSAVFAVVAGAGVSSRWGSWILFTNAQDFGVDDPQFGMDAGFYVFRLPFLSFLVDWAFASLIIIVVITAGFHYLNGGIRFQGAAQRVTPQVKAHLSVLLAVLALIRAGGYWLDRYRLTLSTRGTVDGATYTDVKAELPALYLLLLISLAAVVLFLINIRRRGWVLPMIAVGLWAFAAVVAGGLYPAFIQRFRVEPSESSREAPYIARNIEATQAALGISSVEDTGFAADGSLDAAGLEANAETVRNVRLWDPTVLVDTYQKLEEIRPFYRIGDVDVDRYDIEGETTQVVLSARELNTAGVPQDSWEARHLAYTHGYGAVLAPANSKTANGRPNTLVSDIPVSTTEDFEIDQPGIYVGEGLSQYVVVDTDRREIDFQNADGTQFTRYDGEDGVGIGSFLRRAAFALRFADINPLISGNIQPQSKILYQRDVKERVKTLAPFLSFDADPYPVLLDGDLVYVIDAYTTSDHYPYAQGADTGQLSEGSGLDRNLNYVRNSVKAVVDAYDGTVRFYVVDEEDPVLAAYRQAFPDLFTDQDDMPDALREHFRYPEDLFRVQTNMWGRYHIEDPDDFYNQADAWDVAQDPGSGSVQAVTQQLDPETGQPTGPARENRIDPYYLLMRLPGSDSLEFVMLRPFVPVSGDDSQRLLTAFMVAKSDPENYGQLQTFVMPRADLPDGPTIVAANMQQNEEVSRLQTLLGQSGSEVRYGNLVLIPLDQSLLYVRPFYVQAASTQIPELRKVIVSFNGEVVVNDTLQGALTDLFGTAPPTQEEAPAPGEEASPEEGGPSPAPAPEGEEDVADLLAQAETAFEEAQTALTAGDLAEYQAKVEEAAELVARASEGSDSGATTTTTVPPPSA